jgi:hypothetical protein
MNDATKIVINGKSLKLSNGSEVFIGLRENSDGYADGYFVKFHNAAGQVRKFSITKEAFEAMIVLKPYVDLTCYRPEAWTEVRSEWKETTPENYQNSERSDSGE